MNPKLTKLKEEVEAIRKANGGFLTPEKLVQAAKSKDSYLHRFFTWDDSRAAQLYRLDQARHLVRRIYIEIKGLDEKVVRIRDYASLVGDRGKGSYRGMADVLTDEDLRLQFLDEMTRELEGFGVRLKALKLAATYYARATQGLNEVEKALKEEKAFHQARLARKAR